MTSKTISSLAFILLCTSGIPAAHAGDAASNWTESCARCHGDDGRGRTRMGRKLRIKDLTSPNLQHRLTDERILETIADGKQDDRGGERMPPFRGELSEEDRRALAVYIQNLAEKSKRPNSN